ncbi:MAG: hypothetical protein ACFFDT_00205 [Candidatus Hodarchaeota archaeon]
MDEDTIAGTKIDILSFEMYRATELALRGKNVLLSHPSNEFNEKKFREYLKFNRHKFGKDIKEIDYINHIVTFKSGGRIAFQVPPVKINQEE